MFFPSAARLSLVIALAAAPLLCAPAQAQGYDSAYTSAAIKACKLLKEEDGGVRSFRCPAFAGVPVNLLTEDDGATIDFGRKGLSDEFAFGSFAVAGDRIEWRYTRSKTDRSPFAAILRYSVGPSVGGPMRPVLVVYRLNGRESSCVVARIDGRPANANQQARDIADTKARTFRCGVDSAQDMTGGQ